MVPHLYHAVVIMNRPLGHDACERMDRQLGDIIGHLGETSFGVAAVATPRERALYAERLSKGLIWSR